MAKFKTKSGIKPLLAGAVLMAGFAGPGRAAEGPAAAGGTQAAEALEPLITDRPDFTESTETVPPGMLQVEAGLTAARSGGARSYSFGEVLVRHPVGPRTELRFELPSYAIDRDGGRSSGWEDGAVGFKHVLARGGGYGFSRPRVSLLAGTSIPSGSRSRRVAGLQPEAKLLLAVDLNEKVGLSSNINYGRLKDGGGRYNEWAASLSLGVGLSEKWGTFVEGYAFFPDGGRRDTSYLNSGFTYQVNPNLQLDIRAGVGLGNAAGGPDYFYGVGVARRF